jgi:hypothetical protein
MADDDKKDQSNQNALVEYFTDMGMQKGAACASVKDGHVIFFQRAFLEKLLSDNPDKEQLCLFLKQSEFKN